MTQEKISQSITSPKPTSKSSFEIKKAIFFSSLQDSSLVGLWLIMSSGISRLTDFFEVNGLTDKIILMIFQWGFAITTGMTVIYCVIYDLMRLCKQLIDDKKDIFGK